jgi:hypothetical protein
MQRGTGLEDSLNRAGVDLNQMLNENYYKFQQDALNRKQNAINSILNTSYGQGQRGQSAFEAGAQGFGGFLGEQKDLGKDLYGFFNDLFSKNQPNSALNAANQTLRIGYKG